MAVRRQAQIRTRQPRGPVPLNRAEQAKSGLIVATSGAHGYSGVAINRAVVAAGTVDLSAAGIAGSGIGFSGSGANAATVPLQTAILAGAPFTIEVLCAVSAVPSLAGFVGVPGAGIAEARALIGFGGGSNRNIYFWGNSADLASGVDWLTDGSLQHVFCVSEGTGAPMRFYRGGVEIASGTTPGTPLAATTATTVRIGDMNAGWASTPTGTIFKSGIYSRALSPAEIAQLTRSAWRQFSRLPRRVYFASAGGGASVVPRFVHQHRQQGIM